jgi:hypothetical protein
MSSPLSQGWLLYLPAACIMQCESKMVPWGMTRSEDTSLTCASKLLLSWDSGGSILVSSATDSNWIGTQFSKFSAMATKVTVKARPVWERGDHLSEPLFLGILSLKRHMELKPTQFCGVHFLYIQQVVPRRVRVMCMRGNSIMGTSSLHANKVKTDGLLYTLLDSSTYENCFGQLTQAVPSYSSLRWRFLSGLFCCGTSVILRGVGLRSS